MSSVALSVVGTTALSIAPFVPSMIKYCREMLSKKSIVKFVVIPAFSGTSTVIQNLKKDFITQLNTADILLVDIEEEALKKDPRLLEKKKGDLHTYELALFPICKQYLTDLLQHLRDTKQKKTVYVYVSTRDLKNYLRTGAKADYFAPTGVLFSKLLQSQPITEFMQHTRRQLEVKHPTLYNTFDELYSEMVKLLKLKRGL